MTVARAFVDSLHISVHATSPQRESNPPSQGRKALALAASGGTEAQLKPKPTPATWCSCMFAVSIYVIINIRANVIL
jgi:hypothetical protein